MNRDEAIRDLNECTLAHAMAIARGQVTLAGYLATSASEAADRLLRAETEQRNRIPYEVKNGRPS